MNTFDQLGKSTIIAYSKWKEIREGTDGQTSWCSHILNCLSQLKIYQCLNVLFTVNIALIFLTRISGAPQSPFAHFAHRYSRFNRIFLTHKHTHTHFVFLILLEVLNNWIIINNKQTEENVEEQLTIIIFHPAISVII